MRAHVLPNQDTMFAGLNAVANDVLNISCLEN